LVGWFQNELEMGPRALGNRSILADPRYIDNKTKLNYFVKHRENWRPFAPSILSDLAEDYISDLYSTSQFMIQTYKVNDEKIDEIPSVIHPGNDTCRPHVVTIDSNPLFYDLIKRFYDITNTPVLLNTSFNDHGEPIVMTPNLAIAGFYSKGLDTLVINDFIISK